MSRKDAKNYPQAIVADLDLELIQEQRRQEPILRGVRPSLYRWSDT